MKTQLFYALFCACFFLSGCTTQTSQENSVRIGYLQNDLHQLAFWVAKNQGYFEDEGLRVEETVYKNGGYEMDGFAAGEIDFGYLGTAPAVTKKANANIDIKQLAQVNNEGSAIVVREGIEELSDLENKTIAVPGYATVQYFLLLKALSEANLSEEQVSVVVTGSPATMREKLETGEIDAFVAWEIYNTQAVEQGIGKILAQSGELFPDHPCCVLAARTGYLQQNPDLAQKIVAIHVKANSFIQQNPETAAEIFANDTGIDKQTVLKAMENIDFTYLPSVEGTREYVDFLRENGKITGVEDTESFLENFFDQSFLEKVS